MSTKIHAAVDALGNPIRLMLTEGQASEYMVADSMISGFLADYIIADRGYDSDAFVLSITNVGAQAVIPPRSNRKKMRYYDAELYKERNLVERFFQKLKNYRRIATRYERLARNYTAMLTVVSIVIWLA